MGNWNSGPRCKGGPKRTVDSCHVLSTRTLNREGLFDLGHNERQLILAGADSLPELLVDCVSKIGTESGKLSVDYDLPSVDGRLGCTIQLSSSPMSVWRSALVDALSDVRSTRLGLWPTGAKALSE